jgi:hypothetical protein
MDFVMCVHFSPLEIKLNYRKGDSHFASDCHLPSEIILQPPLEYNRLTRPTFAGIKTG